MMRFDAGAFVDALTATLRDIGVQPSLVTAVGDALKALTAGRIDEAAHAWVDIVRAAERLDPDTLERWSRRWGDLVSHATLGGDSAAPSHPVVAFVQARLEEIGAWPRAGAVTRDELVERAATWVGPALQWVSDACVRAALDRTGGTS